MFQGIIGRLQPILSRLPKKFEEITLASREVRDAARQRFLAEIEHGVNEPDASTFDLSAASTEDLEIPPLPEPALTLMGIDRAMIQPSTRPPGTDWHPLDVGAYSLQSPGMAAPIRVTTDADVFDASSDSITEGLFSV